jgi:FkbM family methyltransferase
MAFDQNNLELKNEIRKYYLKLLEREPNMSDIQFYINKIRNKEIQLEHLEMIFKNSSEYIRLQQLKKDLSINPHVVSKIIDEHIFYLDANDKPLLDTFYQDEVYEKGTVSALAKLLKKDVNVINIGANIGYFTLLIARHVGPKGKVFAFEPSSNTIKFLQKNVEINDYKNVEIYNKGVSNKTGKANLWVGAGSVHNLISTKEIYGLEKITIETITIDDFLRDKDVKIDFVMMDAEGSEKFILDGMTKTIENNPKLQIITEYNPYILELAGSSGKEFLDKIEEIGFLIHLINEETSEIEPITKEVLLKQITYPKYTNLYLVKN